MNGGQQNQSGYSSGFYGPNPIQRQNQEMYNTSFGSGGMYSMHQPHGVFSHQMIDNSPIKISPTVPDTSVEQFTIRQKSDNSLQVNSNCITSMDRYSTCCLEELRCADYKKGRKGAIIARQGSFHSSYGNSSSYMQKSSDLIGPGMFGQKAPDASNNFSLLAQTGFTSQPRSSTQSIFSPNAPSTNIFGQNQNSSFMQNQNQNSSFLQNQNNSFQQPQSNTLGGGFSVFGQGAGGVQQNQQPQSFFSSGLSAQQQPLSSSANAFSNSSMLGSGSNVSQSPISGLRVPSFGGSLSGGVNMQNTSGQSSLEMLNAGSTGGGLGSNTFSMGNNSGAPFRTQQQNTFGGSLQAASPSPFSQAEALPGTPSSSPFGAGLQSAPSLAGSLGQSGLAGSSLGGGAFGSQGLGTGQQLGSTQGSTFGGFNSGQSYLQTGKLGDGLGATKLGETAAASSFGAPSTTLGQTPKLEFGAGLGISPLSKSAPGSEALNSNEINIKSSLPFSAGLGGGSISSFGGCADGALQNQSTGAFGSGIREPFGSGSLGDSKLTHNAPSSGDPYLIRSLDFKECDEYKKKSLMEIPAPLFKKAPTTKIKFKAMGSFKEFVTNTKEKEKEKKHAHLDDIEDNEYYTIPSISQIKKMQVRKISGFVIGRKNHGRVEFLEEVDLTNMNLNTVISMVNIEDSYIFFNYDEKVMPPGKGINKAIRIVLENVVPYSHSLGSMKNLSESDPCYGNMKSRLLSTLPKGAAIESTHFNPADGIITINCSHLWTEP